MQIGSAHCFGNGSVENTIFAHPPADGLPPRASVLLKVWRRGALPLTYIAGGIVPKLGTTFAESAFRARFEAKGRFRGYLAAIPTYVITRPIPALLGAAKLLERAE
ncbi:glucokinase [Bradyrhizobium sp. CCBAU 51765]|uniref:glucokinase n=1 Tax=Bradyrhizobium sp. CCBAU 51765 TaxID=1325102 RepID=UPI00352D99D4